MSRKAIAFKNSCGSNGVYHVCPFFFRDRIGYPFRAVAEKGASNTSNHRSDQEALEKNTQIILNLKIKFKNY